MIFMVQLTRWKGRGSKRRLVTDKERMEEILKGRLFAPYKGLKAARASELIERIYKDKKTGKRVHESGGIKTLRKAIVDAAITASYGEESQRKRAKSSLAQYTQMWDSIAKSMHEITLKTYEGPKTVGPRIWHIPREELEELDRHITAKLSKKKYPAKKIDAVLVEETVRLGRVPSNFEMSKARLRERLESKK